MSKSRLIILVLAVFLIAGTAAYAFAGPSTDTTNPSIDTNNKQALAAQSVASVYSSAKVKWVDTPDSTGKASAYVLKSNGAYNWFWISNTLSTTTQLEIYNSFALAKLTQSSVTIYTDASGNVNRVTVF